MPTIFEPEDLQITEKNGVNITTLADRARLGTEALQVQRVALESGARSESFDVENAERFVYVIRGRGQAHMGETGLPLDAESILWLEKGDTFYLEAGAEGLEVLLCRAPAGE